MNFKQKQLTWFFLSLFCWLVVSGDDRKMYVCSFPINQGECGTDRFHKFSEFFRNESSVESASLREVDFVLCI